VTHRTEEVSRYINVRSHDLYGGNASQKMSIDATFVAVFLELVSDRIHSNNTIHSRSLIRTIFYSLVVSKKKQNQSISNAKRYYKKHKNHPSILPSP
jgi:hypothetical protein